MQTSVRDVEKFVKFATDKIGLKSLPRIRFVGSSENRMRAFGHFLGTKSKSGITVRITGRHPIDVMRTLAHELIHYDQVSRGIRGSARMKEDEANALAGRIMRDFDSAHPEVFNHSVIKEDGVAPVSTNAVGGSSPYNPNSPVAMPEMPFFKKVKRKPKMANLSMPQTVRRPKKLRDILGKGALNRQHKNENKRES